MTYQETQLRAKYSTAFHAENRLKTDRETD